MSNPDLGSQCFECGAPAVHDHHVVPRSIGGTRTVPLCEACHGKVHLRDMTTRGLTRAALQAKRAKGERAGEVPYGFQLAVDGVTLERNEAEQAVIARVCEAAANGVSQRAIVAELAAAGIVARSGNPLGKTQIARILSKAA